MKLEAIFVDAKEPRIALAVYGSRKLARVVRTMNGGQFWDDMTANLPESAAHGIVADLTSGAVYVATDAGVFMSADDGATWEDATPGMPREIAMDVLVDTSLDRLVGREIVCTGTVHQGTLIMSDWKPAAG